MNEHTPVMSVSQVNHYIKAMMEQDDVLSGVFVRGEISNYKLYPSGHHYFSLKDAQGVLRCVMFRSDSGMLRFRPENGMQVVAAGYVSVFPRDGQYQLYCSYLSVEGAGDLQVAFEQLKQQLMEQGLFDPEHKKPLPEFPRKIALVTSGAGAAVQDMIRILGARWPMCEVLVVPVRVQGEEAAEEIAAAIDYVDYYKLADLIITGRGGGSMEDLWAFNEEPVAQAIFRSEIPVISAVGHEPDVTISDFVADVRAATPSNAAELAVPDRAQLQRSLEQLAQRLEQAIRRTLYQAREQLGKAMSSRVMTRPDAYIQDRRLALDYHSRGLIHAMKQKLAVCRERFARQAAGLDALSPLKVLGRGYSVVYDEQGSIITRSEQVQIGQRVDVRVNDGTLICRVEERKC